MNNATTVVLLRNALSPATGTITLRIAPVRLFGIPIRFFTIHCVTPVYVMPAIIINSTATTRTLVLEKPA